MRKWRKKDHARHTAQTARKRQATSQQRSTREHERMTAETRGEGKRIYRRKVPMNAKEWQLKPLRRERRLQRMSTNQHKRLAVETPEERERRLQRMKAIHTGPSASKALPDDAAGLDPVICIAHGALVVLTSNLWTEFGLVNGAMATVIAICYKSGQVPPNQFLLWYSSRPTQAPQEQFLSPPSTTPGLHQMLSVHTGQQTAKHNGLYPLVSVSLTHG